jgi:hypothetical protein
MQQKSAHECENKGGSSCADSERCALFFMWNGIKGL